METLKDDVTNIYPELVNCTEWTDNPQLAYANIQQIQKVICSANGEVKFYQELIQATTMQSGQQSANLMNCLNSANNRVSELYRLLHMATGHYNNLISRLNLGEVASQPRVVLEEVQDTHTLTYSLPPLREAA